MIEETKKQIEELTKRITEIENKISAGEREKDFAPTKEKLSNLIDDLGVIEVVSSVPTHTPVHPLKKIVIYKSGATYRLYVWDNQNNAWNYASLT